jgi:hypothetical protein
MPFWSNWFGPDPVKLRERCDVSGLIEALGNSNATIRAKAVEASLDLLRAPGGHKRLAAFARGLHHASPAVGQRTAEVLGACGLKAAAPLLAQALFHSRKAISAAATAALSSLGPVALPAVESLLENPKLSDLKRAVVLRALASLDPEKGRSAASRLVAPGGTSGALMETAGSILVELSSGAEKVLLDKSAPRAARLAAVARLPEGPLGRVLSDKAEEPSLRVACVRRLAVLKERQGGKLIVSLAKSKAETLEVRGACLCALAGFQVRGALAVLRAAIKESDPEVRASAAWALAAYGGAEAVGLLREALDDPYVERVFVPIEDSDISLSRRLRTPVYPVREAAARAIRSHGSSEARLLLPGGGRVGVVFG